MKIHQFILPAEVSALLVTTGVTVTGAKMMQEKAIGLAVEIGEVSPSLGNIIKQEALAVGADAAVHEKTSRCEVPQTKIVLVGTLVQLRRFAQKLQKNVATLPAIGRELADTLTKKFPSQKN